MPWYHLGITWTNVELECATSNGNRYPPYPSVMTTALPYPYPNKLKPKGLDEQTDGQ